MIHENVNGGFHRLDNRTELGLIPATRALLKRIDSYNNPRLNHILYPKAASHGLWVVK